MAVIGPSLRFSNLQPPLTRPELLVLRQALIDITGQPASPFFDVKTFLEGFHAEGRPHGYGPSPDQLAAYSRVRDSDAHAASAYLKLALVELLLRLIEQDRLRAYPESIREQYEIHLSLMRQALERDPADYFRLDNDLLLKDLALADERILPGGAQLLQVNGGVPRSILWKGGVVQAWRFIRIWPGRIRAFAPFFELHTDDRRMREFTPAGWERFYMRAAELMRLRTEIRGLMGATWWNDPVVPHLSPQLSFLQDLPLRHGAAVFRYDSSDSAKELALWRSPERQLAFDQGRYIPTTYIMVWTRDDLLRWAGAQPPRQP